MSFNLHEQFRKDILKELHLTLVRAYGKDYSVSTDYPTRLQPVFSKLYQYFNMGGAYDSEFSRIANEPNEGESLDSLLGAMENPPPKIEKFDITNRIATLTCPHCHHTHAYRVSEKDFGVNCTNCHQAIFMTW
jgi:hypothetical protein